MTIRIEPIKPHIGAIVHVERSALTADGVAEKCLEALDAHDVLVFPCLGLSDAEQLDFTGRLGTQVNFSRRAPGGDAATPGIYTVTLDPKVNNEPEYVLGTFFWHMDGMPVVEIPPPKATLLSARRLAPKGGQTEFASTRAAYETLPADQKAELENLRVLHTVIAGVRRVLENESDFSKLKLSAIKGERPLVWTSRSGRKSLLIGETADRVVGMPLAEGRALLVRLLEWASQPDFTYRHEWQEGDFVIWNNCSVLHRVVPYDQSSGRTMHRTSLAGVDAAA
jgi:alpha-ketoglutarate-dependent taurine dioxygenase